MKKFEEEMEELFGGPLGFSIKFQNGYEAYSLFVKHFKGWVSPEDHQNIVASKKALEKSNLRMSEENAKFVVENIELTKEIAELKSQLGKHQEIFAETAKKLKEAELELSKLKFQVEKQKPEIPAFVAEWLEEERKATPDNGLFDIIGNTTSAIHEWLEDISNHDLLAQAWLNGYTVTKDKLFYLKNKLTELYLRFDSDDLFYFESADKESSLYKTTFTQQEIDSMETGSYEQIEVEE